MEYSKEDKIEVFNKLLKDKPYLIERFKSEIDIEKSQALAKDEAEAKTKAEAEAEAKATKKTNI